MAETGKIWDEIARDGDPLKLRLLEFDIEPRSTALLIVDMQKYNCIPDIAWGKVMLETVPAEGKYWFSRLESTVIPNIQRLLTFFRENSLRVCFASFGPLTPDGSDLKPSRRLIPHQRWAQAAGSDHLWCPGTPEHEVIDELAPQAGEIVFDKNTSSPFNSTNIDQILRNMGIESLVIVGVATNSCVETTARDASDRGYDCILVEDGCCARSQDRHDMTMRTFAGIFGKVMRTEEAIGYLQNRL